MRSRLLQGYFQLWVGILALALSGQLLAQGLVEDEARYRTLPLKSSALYGDTAQLPPRVDLTAYVPGVLDQGEFGTCVGVSVGYYMRTMLEAIRLGITDPDSIRSIRYSPSYLYNAIKDSTDRTCMLGSEIGQSLEHLRQRGIVRYAEQGYPYCGTNTLEPPASSRILDYISLYGLLSDPSTRVAITKKALSENSPVVIGIITTPTLDKLGYWEMLWKRFIRWIGWISPQDDDFAVWQPADAMLRGGHAVCLVGYDDTRSGGAFKAVNSRGKNWGDEGFFWIRYSDFAKHAKYAYQAFLNPHVTPDEPVLSADVNFLISESGQSLPDFELITQPHDDTLASHASYRLLGSLQTGTTFKLQVEVQKQSYLYVLNANATQNKSVVLFPQDSVSALIGSRSVVWLPTNHTSKSFTLIPPTGTEYLLFLFSEKPLDIHFLVRRMNFHTGAFTEKVYRTFGENMIPMEKLNYKEKKVGFFLTGEHSGSIVPLLLSFDHTKTAEGPGRRTPLL